MDTGAGREVPPEAGERRASKEDRRKARGQGSHCRGQERYFQECLVRLRLRRMTHICAPGVAKQRLLDGEQGECRLALKGCGTERADSSVAMEGLETQGGGRRTCVLSEMGVPGAYPRAEERSEEHSPEWALWGEAASAMMRWGETGQEGRLSAD